MDADNKDQIDTLDPEDDLDSKDSKKLSKGQLKKLKEKAKKDKDEKEKQSEPPPASTSQKNGEADPQPAETPQEEADDADKEGESQTTDKKGLTKGQLKKLKEKEKAKKEGKAEPGKAAEETKDEEEADKGDSKDKKKGGKKGGVSAVAKLAQQRLEEQKKLEEERKKLEDELRRKEEEERRIQEEEEKRIKEEEERKRKEKEAKIQKLKDEGVYKSRKDREREAELARRREELIAQGIVSADHFDKTNEKPKSKVVRTKKQKPKKETDQHQAGEAHDGEEDKEDEKEELKKAEDFDNWEAELEGNAAPRQKLEEENLPEDSWENFDKSQKKPEELAKKPSTTIEGKAKDKPYSKKEPAVSKDTTGKEVGKAEVKPKTTKEEDKTKEPVVAAGEEQKVEEKPVEKESHPHEAKPSGPSDKIRSPIICILGHVDTGKTKLLDNMRRTNVQEGEAGGITQQIGATFFPYEKLVEECAKVQGHYPFELQVPGLLIIDTPGHESFSNLRSRGSGLSDIAILVVDIMHGLQKQTLESIELLKFRKTPFVIALNKIDRIYGWKSKPDTSSYLSLKKQDRNAVLEFRDRSKKIITELTEKGFNVALYYDNPDPNNYVSIIPTSAMTGEGISDLLSVAVNLTQKWLKKKINKKDEFKCTVLEVKVIEGLGASIDVMLVDGTLHEGDKIVLAGYEGPIVTSVRALLTPHPMKEMRVKNEYVHHKSISGAMGIKISANDLEKALAGSELYVAKNAEEEENFKKLVEEEVTKVKKSIKLVDEGVLVAASTLGSLEALLQFLKTSHIPVSNISIGPISKTEVIKAMKPLQITEGEVKKEFATILAFDVKVLQDAKDLADQEGVKIFTANIIYHLFDHFTAYLNDLREERKRNEGKLAVFPAVLKPVAFFNMKDPIVMGVDVVEGQLRIGTPLAVLEKGKLRIGSIESIEREHKPLQVARPIDGSIAIKIKGDTTIMAGRHFELKDKLISIVSRESIDALKKYFRDEMSKADWELIKKLKGVFGVI